MRRLLLTPLVPDWMRSYMRPSLFQALCLTIVLELFPLDRLPSPVQLF